MTSCTSNKKGYITEEIAVDALIEAHTKYQYKEDSGPVGVYRCEDCGQYHLTSKGPANPRLQQMIREGKINLHREANQWLHKLKGR
ncbi:MAG: hypothetical protein WAZ98_10400 [Cyclobacteriaceae bacterium]